MRTRVHLHPMFPVVISGLVSSAIATLVFHTANSGFSLRPGHAGDADPTIAASAAFAILGFVTTIAVMLFEEDETRTNWESNELHRGHVLDRFTAFVRRPWYRVFSLGPISGLLAAASVVSWTALAQSPGEPGTVWGDYLQSPLPALVVVLCCWILVTLGLMFNGIGDACSRTSKAASITVFVLSFVISLLVNPVILVLALSYLPTVQCLVVCLPILLLALGAQFATRRWAMGQARLLGYDRPRPLGALRRSSLASRIGSAFARREGSSPFGVQGQMAPFGAQLTTGNHPPFDVLNPGERILMWLRGDRTRPPQMLVATDRRFMLVSTTGHGRGFVLAQAGPGQLLGGTSHYPGADAVTSAHFSDHPPMHICGQDPIASARFADALNNLARTGSLPS